jgi:phosphonate transport system substrate-binding protein
MNIRSLPKTLSRWLSAAVVLLMFSTAAPAQNPNPDRIRVALLPDENAATLIQNAEPLKRYLSEVLGKRVEIVVTTDYSSMIEAMRFGRIEIGYFGPFSYVLAKSRAEGIEAFAVGVEKGLPSYQSVLIATANGPVQSLDDIRGRPFAFGDQASTSSHLSPRAHLVKNGLVGDEDYRVVHLGTHDGVARAVQAGQVPAGALSLPILRNLIDRGTIDESRIRQIALTDPIPNYPITMQGYLAPELKEKIRQAFLQLKDPEILQSFRVEGFEAADDSAYDVLRETARLLNLDIGRMN